MVGNSFGWVYIPAVFFVLWDLIRLKIGAIIGREDCNDGQWNASDRRIL